MTEPNFTHVEIAVKFIGDDYKSNREVYVQRISFDWYMNRHSALVQQIAAVVNDLKFPDPIYVSAGLPGAYQEVK